MANLVGMEVVVEIDENERYWVGKGYGKGGMLPSDRGAFSTIDGSLSWKSVEEASEDLLLLGRGWVYRDAGFSPTNKEDPDNCWLYSNDFNQAHLAQAKPDQSARSWVRFRRLNRIKVFHPEEFVSKEVYEKCDHCDSSPRDSLSAQILEILSYCTLLHNKTQVTDAIALPLKKTIIEIAIAHEPKQGSDANYELGQLRKKLENFIEKERSHTVMSRMFSGVDFTYFGRDGRKEFKERCDDITARCLPKSERDAIASLVVRKLDTKYQLHCNKVGCGDNCDFAIVSCPNKGCSQSMSKMYLANHDAVCPHKVIHCDCGDIFTQLEWPHHLTEVCKLRDVKCPLSNIGCLKVIKACDLQQHILDDSCSHLLMAVNRITEQGKVINGLKSKLSSLEKEHKGLSEKLEQYQNDNSREMAELAVKEQRTSKTLSSLEAACKKEFKKR